MRSTTAPVRRPGTPPVVGSSRNPIKVSSASPKKIYSRKNATGRTRINKSLKRPSPIKSTPSISPPRQRRRRHSPQQSGIPSIDTPASGATMAPAANSEVIEISSDSELSNSEAAAVVHRWRGASSALTDYPTICTPSESGDDLPAPAFMFRNIGASPDDMYDSDSPAEGTARTLVPTVRDIINAAASPDDMYDSDSPAQRTPSTARALVPSIQHITNVAASPDDMYDSDSPAERTPSMARTLAPSVQRLTNAGPSNPAGLPLAHTPLTTNSSVRVSTRRRQQLVAPTPYQTPRGYTRPGLGNAADFASPFAQMGALGRTVTSVSPFAHLSQAELDSLIEDGTRTPSKPSHK